MVINMKFFYETIRHGQLHCNLVDSLDFPAHIHDNLEFVYVIEGSAKAFYEGEEYSLEKGDAFIVFPQRIHYYSESKNISAVNSIVPIEYLPEFRSAFLNNVLVTPHIKNAPLFAGELLKKAATAKNLHYKAFRRGAILAAFSLFLDDAQFIDKKSPDTTTLQKILDYCENHYKENISLENISKELFISKSYISHIFSEKIHMSFRDYINSLRVSLSLNYLKEGKLPITEVSSECGFESIRSFNRAFKKIHDATPSEYRKNFLNLM